MKQVGFTGERVIDFHGVQQGQTAPGNAENAVGQAADRRMGHQLLAAEDAVLFAQKLNVSVSQNDPLPRGDVLPCSAQTMPNSYPYRLAVVSLQKRSKFDRRKPLW